MRTADVMRRHGNAVVGRSLKTAVGHAIYTEFNARVQADALRLGGNVTFLNEKEAANTSGDDYERPWKIWKNQALSRSQQRQGQ
jgi:ribulose-5-phosphate 4-epimerase/fuculose-1-phosphate aldolase